MPSNSLPAPRPEDLTGRKFGRPSQSPKLAGALTSWLISASKKVDDISKHESNYDPKKDPKNDANPKHPDVLNPGVNHREGGKPMAGDVRKS